MRILFSIPSLCFGGAETFLVSFINGFIKTEGNEVFLLNLNYNNFQNNNPLESRLLLPDQNYINLIHPNWVKIMQRNPYLKKVFRRFIKNTYLKIHLRKVPTIINTIRPDIINSHLINSDRIITSLDLKIPVIITNHGDYLDARHIDRINILNKGTFIICVSVATQSILKTIYFKNNVKAIHNGVSSEKNGERITRSSLGIPEKSFVFLMLARGIKEKGWYEAFNAFIKMKNFKNSFFIAVGQGPGIDEIIQIAKVEKIENCLFPGYQTNPAQYIQVSDVGLLPSYFKSESFPMSLIEILMAGKPLIASNLRGILEIITDPGGDAGILVDVEGKVDVKQLAKAMEDIYLNYAFYHNNAEHCRMKFTLEKCIEEYKIIYQQSYNQYYK